MEFFLLYQLKNKIKKCFVILKIKPKFVHESVLEKKIEFEKPIYFFGLFRGLEIRYTTMDLLRNMCVQNLILILFYYNGSYNWNQKL